MDIQDTLGVDMSIGESILKPIALVLFMGFFGYAYCTQFPSDAASEAEPVDDEPAGFFSLKSKDSKKLLKAVEANKAQIAKLEARIEKAIQKDN